MEAPFVIGCEHQLQVFRLEPAEGATLLAPPPAALVDRRTGVGGLPGAPGRALRVGLNWMRLRVTRSLQHVATAQFTGGKCSCPIGGRSGPPRDGVLYHQMMIALLMSGFPDVLKAWSLITNQYPDPRSPFHQLGGARVEFLKSEMVANAVAVTSEDPSDVRRTDPELVQLARSYLERAQDALTADPSRWDAWHDLALALSKFRHDDAARVAFLRALANWPGSFWSFRHLGELEGRLWRHGQSAGPDGTSAEMHGRLAARYLQLARHLCDESPLRLAWFMKDVDLALRKLRLSPGAHRPHR